MKLKNLTLDDCDMLFVRLLQVVVDKPLFIVFDHLALTDEVCVKLTGKTYNGETYVIELYKDLKIKMYRKIWFFKKLVPIDYSRLKNTFETMKLQTDQ